jgi:hypothetical protein
MEQQLSQGRVFRPRKINVTGTIQQTKNGLIISGAGLSLGEELSDEELIREGYLPKPGSSRTPLLQRFPFCIPNEICESMWGDLCEMEEDMYLQGRPRLAIGWEIGKQILVLCFYWGIHRVIARFIRFRGSKVD